MKFRHSAFVTEVFILFVYMILGFNQLVFAEDNNIYISASADKESYSIGNTVKLNISSNGECSAFLLSINYDAEKLRYKNMTVSPDVYYRNNLNEGCINVVVTAKSGLCPLDILTASFSLIDDTENAYFDIITTDIADAEGNLLSSGNSESVTVKVADKPSSEARILSISPSSGKLNEEFGSDITSYTMNVPYSCNKLSFDCEVSPGATYRINRTNLGSGGSVTDFEITVTAEDGKTKTTYTIAVTRGEYSPGESADEGKSSEALLLSVKPIQGELNETFSSDVFLYTMSVPYSVKTMEFDCEVSEGASYKVNRKNLGSGGSVTDFEITVTSEDGKTKNKYTVTVTRAEYEYEKEEGNSEALLLSLSPSDGKLNEEFSPYIQNYTMSVTYKIKQIEFDCTVSEGASYKVNRRNLGSGGSTTDFEITVTSEDKTNKNIYMISVSRGEYVRPGHSDDSSEEPDDLPLPILYSIVPSEGELNETFDPERTAYTMTVPFEVKTLSFACETAEGDSYKINRKNLGAGGSAVDFKITVSSSETKKKNTYVISVTRLEKIKTEKNTKSDKSKDESSFDEVKIVPKYGKNSEITIIGNRFTGYLLWIMCAIFVAGIAFTIIKISNKKK
ncbi:MAG: cadherin-like beta sandwich domain-containing protein [Clostridia bacterium]|nr:cadherin-like beta sandwich domain-containing protein [Clostridia bacterium]